MTNDNRKDRAAVTKETAQATRRMFREIFGDDAEAIALELMQLPLGVATTPAGKLIEDMAQAERDVFEFECQQRADEVERAAEDKSGGNSSSQIPIEPLAIPPRIVPPSSSANPPIPSSRPVVKFIDLYAPAGRGVQWSAAASHKPSVSPVDRQVLCLLKWEQDEITWTLERRKEQGLSELVLSCSRELAVTPSLIEWVTAYTGEIQKISLVARGGNVFYVDLGPGYAISRIAAIEKRRRESVETNWIEWMPIVRFAN